MNYPLEIVEQQRLAKLFDYLELNWFHVPNERREERERRILASQGVKSGVPDNIVLTPPPSYPAVRFIGIELKRHRGAKPKVSDNQKQWLGLCSENRGIGVVLYGIDDVCNFIIDAGYCDTRTIERWAALSGIPLEQNK